MNFAKFTQEEVEQKLLKIIAGKKLSFRFGEVKITHDMYFVRIRLEENGKKFDHIDDFWAPPAEFTNVGRCNIKGAPKLYTVVGTNINRDLLSLIEEVNIKPNCPFTVIVYKLKRHIKPFNVPVSLDLFPSLEPDPSNVKQNSASKFILSEFMTNPEKGLRERYKSTAAITKMLMNPNGHRSKSPIFSYPSCAMNRALKIDKNGVTNIAWDPDFSRDTLQIKSLRRITITSDTGWDIGDDLDNTKKTVGVKVEERGFIEKNNSVRWQL